MGTTIVRQLEANFAWSKLTINCAHEESFSCLAYFGEFKVICIESTLEENTQFISVFNMVDIFLHLDISFLNNLNNKLSYLDSKNHEVHGSINCGGSNYP